MWLGYVINLTAEMDRTELQEPYLDWVDTSDTRPDTPSYAFCIARKFWEAVSRFDSSCCLSGWNITESALWRSLMSFCDAVLGTLSTELAATKAR